MGASPAECLTYAVLNESPSEKEGKCATSALRYGLYAIPQ